MPPSCLLRARFCQSQVSDIISFSVAQRICCLVSDSTTSSIAGSRNRAGGRVTYQAADALRYREGNDIADLALAKPGSQETRGWHLAFLPCRRIQPVL